MEEERDTHFKRKRKKSEPQDPTPKEPTRKEATQKEPRKKQAVKRAHRDARQAPASAVSESIVEVPPSSLIIRFPGRKEMSMEPAQVPGKLDPLHTIFPYPFSLS